MKTPILAAAVSIALSVVAFAALAAEPPTIEDVRAARAQLSEHLDQDELPFWTSDGYDDPSLAGALVHLTPQQMDPAQGPVRIRPLIAQLRLLWVYDLALRRTDDPDRQVELLERAHRQLDRIIDVFWDDQGGGGWFNGFDEQRRPIGDDTKPSIVQIYAMYVLSALQHEALSDQALPWAVRTFDLLEAGWDDHYGGYFDHYNLPHDHPENQFKQTGTNFHALQALTELYESTDDETHRRRLESLIRLATLYFTDHETKESPALLRPDWSLLDESEHDHARRTIYGHTVELVWYTLDGIEALDQSPAQLTTWARMVSEGILEHGVAPHGPVRHVGNLGGELTSEQVLYWAQAEGLIMFLRMYELTGDPVYWEHFRRLRDWTFEHVVGKGDFWANVSDMQGNVTQAAAGIWTSGLHVTRALEKSEQILERIEQRLEAQQENQQ